MARDRAAIRLDIWTDDDFRALSVSAQHLYLHLLSSPTLSYAGIADWRPARIAGMSKGATKASVTDAAGELTRGFFIILDEETEEVLIRSFLKHDGLMNKPNVAKAMVTAYGKTVSSLLRGVMVHELVRMNERTPELRSFQEEGVSELLTKPAINPFELELEGFQKDVGKGSNFDPSLLTTNSLLLTPSYSLPTTSPDGVRDEVKDLCYLLVNLMTDNGDKAPTITQGWLDAARLMLDKDGREYDAAVRLMRWTLADSFWRGNIRSMPTFREKFDQLRHAANAKQAAVKPTPEQRARQTMALATDIDMREIVQ